MTESFFLGLHLGHDASASIVRESGEILASILQERHTRIRHDYGLSFETVKLALQQAGVALNDISAVGVSVTQQIPSFLREPAYISVREPLNLFPHDRIVSYRSILAEADLSVREQVLESLRLRRIPSDSAGSWEILMLTDPLFRNARIPTSLKSSEVLDLISARARPSRQNRLIFGSKVRLQIHNRKFPAVLWSHHAAHAASNVAFSSKDRVIITHDGGTLINGGGVWEWSNEFGLRLLSPHYMVLGQIYDLAAEKLGLGVVGGAGKMMGLAPYGSAIIPLPKINGPTCADLADSFGCERDLGQVFSTIWRYCLQSLEHAGVGTLGLGSSDNLTEGAPAEIANFFQRLVQVGFTGFAEQVVQRTGQKTLGLSGGFALNCPTNSSVFSLTGVEDVVIEPHCDDGGCSVGSAFLSSGLGSKRRKRKRLYSPPNSHTSSYAFLGLEGEPKSAVDSIRGWSAKHDLEVRQGEHLEDVVAQKLVGGEIGSVFGGRSEVGPRALGNRSIIVSPTSRENWTRVNLIKTREWWRPFAPIVSEEDLKEYFDGGPSRSPFMLFNYNVLPAVRSKIPAVTHVDCSSRVQTVICEDGRMWRLLGKLKSLGHPGLILNTSFNGPGEPIVEGLENAFRLFEETAIDFLWVVVGQVASESDSKTEFLISRKSQF